LSPDAFSRVKIVKKNALAPDPARGLTAFPRLRRSTKAGGNGKRGEGTREKGGRGGVEKR